MSKKEKSEDSEEAEENEEEGNNEGEEDSENGDGEDEEEEEREEQEENDEEEDNEEDDKEDEDQDKKKNKKGNNNTNEEDKGQDEIPMNLPKDKKELSKPQSLLSILEDINSDMDILFNEIQANFSHKSISNTPPQISSPILYSHPKASFLNPKEELCQLLAQATQLAKAIDRELIFDNNDETKEIRSQGANIMPKASKKEEALPPRSKIHPPSQTESFSNRPFLPYDPNKYKDYYSSLDSNRNNRIMENNQYNNIAKDDSYAASLKINPRPLIANRTSQVIQNDNIYSNSNRGMNTLPIIHSQHSNEMRSSIESNKNNFNPNEEYIRKENSLLPYTNSKDYYLNNLLINNTQQKKDNPFERN